MDLSKYVNSSLQTGESQAHRFTVEGQYESYSGQGVLFPSGRSVIDWDDGTMTTLSDQQELQVFLQKKQLFMTWYTEASVAAPRDAAAFFLAIARRRRSQPEDVIEEMARSGAHVVLDHSGQAAWKQAQYVSRQSMTSVFAPTYESIANQLVMRYPPADVMASMVEEAEAAQAAKDKLAENAARIGIDLASSEDLRTFGLEVEVGPDGTYKFRR